VAAKTQLFTVRIESLKELSGRSREMDLGSCKDIRRRRLGMQHACSVRL
jgi:hypothetical protein